MAILGSALDSDAVLRLKASCATANSHYDQVVAVSQNIINEAFASLYGENSDMAKIDFSARGYGSISGNLYPPRLLLGGRLGSTLNLASALYVMHFKNGTLAIPAGTDDPVDLTDWKLAVKIDLDQQFVVVDPTADARTRERQQRIWDFIHNKFDIPGDYTITRLYAKLSGALWNTYYDELSQFGHNENGSPRSWAQLLEQYPGFDTILPTFLKRWAGQQEDGSMTMTGVKLTVNASEEIGKDPTFQPTTMIHQTFPYTNPAKGVDHPVISYDPPGNLNSLLYCEMVEGNPLPQDKPLATRGIFTTQASSTGGSRIDGTFVLSHQLFLERFLFPMIQGFNAATIICPDVIVFHPEDGSVTWTYDVGFDKSHPNTDSDFYLFKPVPSPGSQDVTAYKFHFSDSLYLVPNGYCPSKGTWTVFGHWGESDVYFKWVPGDKSFNVTGTTVYHFWLESSYRSDGQQPFAWQREGLTYTWSMKINIDSVEGGVLHMSLDAGPLNDCNGNLTVTWHDVGGYVPFNRQIEVVQNEIKTRITTRVRSAREDLLHRFQTTGQLTYPGSGAFEFSDPIIGNSGDILATIAFKNVATKNKVPPPQVPVLSRMKDIPFVSIPVTSHCVAPILKLVWSFSKPVKGASEGVEILIDGKNNSDKAISLVSVAFTLSSGSRGHGLVTGKDFKADKWTIGEPVETKGNVFQILVGTDGTQAFNNVTADAGEETPNGTIPITFSGTGDVSIEPGSTITLALLAGTGVPSTYPVSIVEGWPEEEGKESQSLRREVDVFLS